MPRLTVPVCCLMRWLLISSLDYCTILILPCSFTTSLCHEMALITLQHPSVAWWDGFRLPHYSTVDSMLLLYSRLLPDFITHCFTTSLWHVLEHPSVAWWDGFRLPHYSTVALLHLYAMSTARLYYISMPRLTVPVCCLMRWDLDYWLLISSLDYCTLFFHSFTTSLLPVCCLMRWLALSLCHALDYCTLFFHVLQHWSVAWWDDFRLPHYSTVALLHLYATPYSTRLLPDEMALDYLIILLLLYYISMPRLTVPVCCLMRWL